MEYTKVVFFALLIYQGFVSHFQDNAFTCPFSPEIGGRRWPTGRMKGHSRIAACEKSPGKPEHKEVSNFAIANISVTDFSTEPRQPPVTIRHNTTKAVQ